MYPAAAKDAVVTLEGPRYLSQALSVIIIIFVVFLFFFSPDLFFPLAFISYSRSIAGAEITYSLKAQGQPVFK